MPGARGPPAQGQGPHQTPHPAPPSTTNTNQVVRVVLDNVNNDMLATFNGRLMDPFAPYANRNDVVKFTAKVVSTMSDPPRWVRACVCVSQCVWGGRGYGR